MLFWMIKNFKDKEFTWLSNFQPVRIKYKGVEYPSVEHAYQSAKVDTQLWREFCSSPDTTASAVKKLSKVQAIIKEWEQIKLQVMEECLIEKFKQEPFRSKLIDTYPQEIQEGNWWGDLEWGIDIITGEGQNKLGILIMKIRDNLIDS